MARSIPFLVVVVFITVIVVFTYFSLFKNDSPYMEEIDAETHLQLGRDVVIVLSRGRSGSGYLMRLISNIVDAETDRAITGELWQYNDVKNMTDPSAVIRDHLEKRRRVVGPNGFIGTKWKPYADNERFDKAWRWIAAEGWPVVYSHRNALDVVISAQKHLNATPHCEVGDTLCVESLLNKKVHLNVTKAVQEATTEVAEVNLLRVKLNTIGVRYIEVTYEQLVYGSDAQRLGYLRQIADFLLPQGHREITMQDFSADIEMTTSSNQSQFVDNYPELAAACKGTVLEQLLHG